MNTHLMVVGRGNMGNLLFQGLPGIGVSRPWQDDIFMDAPPRNEKEIAVHVGSGKQFLNLVRYCEKRNVPLIQASSSLTNGKGGESIPEPSEVTFPYIRAPNLALGVIALMRTMPVFANMMTGLGAKVRVVESHQKSKNSAPITAQKFLKTFGVEPEKVDSVREPVVQGMFLGVPPEHLTGHAYHYVVVEVCGVEIGFHTKIHGRGAYAEGLAVLIKKIVEMGDNLKPGFHQAEDLLFG